MKEKIKYYLKEILTFSAVIIIVANILSLYKSQNLNQSKLSLNNVKLINNSIYSIDNTKPLMLHVWATWCPVCKAEADNIQRVSKYYNVLSIAVSSGSDYEVHQYMQEHDLNFKVINDKKGSLAKKLNIEVYPTTFIYNKNGENIFSEVGYTSSFGLFSRMIYVDYFK